MGIHIKEIIDTKEWNVFFLQYGSHSLFQSWQWGEVQKESGESVKRLGIYEDGVLRGMFQLVTVRAKRGSFVHVRHGPILDSQDELLWKHITNELKMYAKKEGCLFFRISPLIDVKYSVLLQSIGYKPAAIHAMDAEFCWVLELGESEENLLKNMRKTTRYEIRKAQQLGVLVNTTDDPRKLEQFFELYNETSKRQGFVPHHGITEEFEIFSREKEILLYTATYENTAIATAIILFTGGQGIYHHGASLSNKIPGSYLIQWEAIKEAKRRGMKQYNFWGIAPSDQPNHPWQGITLFKKGFGGHEQSFLHAHDYPISPFYAVPKAIETIRRMRKGY